MTFQDKVELITKQFKQIVKKKYKILDYIKILKKKALQFDKRGEKYANQIPFGAC